MSSEIQSLDVGCGNQPRADLGCDSYRKSKKYPKNFVLADAEHLPFRDNAFKEAFSYFCFEHLKNPEQAIQELSRVGVKAFFVTDHYLSPYLYMGLTHTHGWFRNCWISLSPLYPITHTLAKLSFLWQKKRPVNVQTTNNAMSTVERSLIVDCKTRNTQTFKALKTNVRITTKKVNL